MSEPEDAFQNRCKSDNIASLFMSCSKKRKSRCGKVKPCPSCVCHETQDDCYGDLYIEKCPQWSVSATSSTGQRTSESSSTSGSSLQTPLDIDMLDMHVIKEECEWPFEQTTHSDWTCLPAHLIPPSVDFMEPLIMTEDLPPLAPFPPINELEAAIYCYITEVSHLPSIRNGFKLTQRDLDAMANGFG